MVKDKIYLENFQRELSEKNYYIVETINKHLDFHCMYFLICKTYKTVTDITKKPT